MKFIPLFLLIVLITDCSGKKVPHFNQDRLIKPNKSFEERRKEQMKSDEEALKDKSLIKPEEPSLLSKIDAPYYSGKKSDHFDGKRFIPDFRISLFDRVRLFFTLRDYWLDDKEEATSPIINDFKPVTKARLVFIGHSTFLIQLSQVNILTNPIWSNYAGLIPLPLVGFKRHKKPAIEIEDLPKIDYVLLTDNSYFNMDITTLKKIHEKFSAKFLTGLGNCYYLNKVRKLGIECYELDWNDKIGLRNDVDFYFVKSKNYSQRGLLDKNKTLWGSFIIKTPEFKIFFAGDTGYSQELRQIGMNYGPFDVALLPIGSYTPRWFFQNIHLSPEEAVKAHLVTNANKSIAMSFNTFQIANEGFYDARIELEKAKESYGLKVDEFLVPKVGEVIEF